MVKENQGRGRATVVAAVCGVCTPGGAGVLECRWLAEGKTRRSRGLHAEPSSAVTCTSHVVEVSNSLLVVLFLSLTDSLKAKEGTKHRSINADGPLASFCSSGVSLSVHLRIPPLYGCVRRRACVRFSLQRSVSFFLIRPSLPFFSSLA